MLRKLLQRVQESLPAKRRVYFLYTHKNGHDRFANGLKANTEISYFCLSALKKAFPSVRFLRLQGEKEGRIGKIRPQDVVIGHVGETYLKAAARTRRLIAFCPWAGHEDRSQDKFNCLPKEIEMGLYDKAASLIFLTSEHNKTEYLEKPRNFWYPYFQKKSGSLRIVHQPIDLEQFRRIKWEYTTDNFLYIGNDAHMKCLDQSKELVNRLGRTLTIYGCDGKQLDNCDKNAVARLPFEADFFIQPGMWEAQCVSILEAGARGFIPIVSPETGYPYSHPFLLRYGDFAYNERVLRDLLATTPEERRALADTLYDQLSADPHHNSWQQLTDVLVDEVRKLL